MSLLVEYAPKVLMALVVLWIGGMLIRMLGGLLGKVLDRRSVEPTLKRFLHSLVTISLKILLFITAIQIMGVETTSFIAIVGAAGLAWIGTSRNARELCRRYIDPALQTLQVGRPH